MCSLVFFDNLRSIFRDAPINKKGKTGDENSAYPIYSCGVFRKAGASLTVEAAFVVPIVLFTIVSVLQFSLYCHDKAVFTYAAQRAGLLAVCEKDEEEMIYLAKETFFEETQGKLLGKWNVDVKVILENDVLEFAVISTSETMNISVNVPIYTF